jgi:hypothetical protein
MIVDGANVQVVYNACNGVFVWCSVNKLKYIAWDRHAAENSKKQRITNNDAK